MTSLFDRRLNGVAIYNPDLLSKQELVAQFVARRAVLEQITADLSRPKFGQHQLIVGHRGMGKTTLLRRIRYAVEDDPRLAAVWMPVTFPEEQYNVSRLSDFYVNCIDALSDALEHAGQRGESARLDDLVDDLPARDEEKRAREALGILLDAADRIQKRLLLLVDNFDLIVERLDKDQQAQWALRELLSREHRLLLIAASPVVIGSTHNYGAPFYDFLQSRTLAGLTFDETREVLATLAKEMKQPGVLEILEKDPARIQTLYVLAGGNPRTIVLLFGVLAQRTDGDVRADLEQLLDQCTPLYKSRFEAMPAQAQQVVDALAIHWDPISAGELADILHLDVNAVSSQLNRLVQQDVVEKVEYDPESKTGFQIAERFFNIWYLMRASRRVRRRLIWLVEFLKLFYGMEQLLDRARALAKSPSRADVRHAELCLAIAEALPLHKPEQFALESRAIRALLESSTPQQLQSFLDLEGDDASLKPIVDRQQWVADLRRSVMASNVNWPGGKDEMYELLSGSHTLTRERKLQAVAVLEGATEEEIEKFAASLRGQREKLAQPLGDRLARLVGQALRDGYIESTADADGLKAAAVAYGEPVLRVLADSGKSSLLELTEIFAASRDPYVAVFLVGGLVRDGDLAAATAVVHQALEESPSSCRLLAMSAFLDHKAFDDVAKEIDGLIQRAPSDGYLWAALGHARLQQNRLEEACQAFQRATELAPRQIEAHRALATSLLICGRFEEAETAARRAIELSPDDVGALLILTQTALRAGKNETAIASAQRAVEVDSENMRAKATLALVLMSAGRIEEAVGLAIPSAERESVPVDVRAFMLTVVALFGEVDRAFQIFDRQLADEAFFTHDVSRHLMRSIDALVERGYATWVVQSVEQAGRTEELRPTYEALRIHVSGKRSTLRKLAPELRQAVVAILDRWRGNETEAAQEPAPRRKRRSRR